MRYCIHRSFKRRWPEIVVLARVICSPEVFVIFSGCPALLAGDAVVSIVEIVNPGLLLTSRTRGGGGVPQRMKYFVISEMYDNDMSILI
jgi:hypothetical protein